MTRETLELTLGICLEVRWDGWWFCCFSVQNEVDVEEREWILRRWNKCDDINILPAVISAQSLFTYFVVFNTSMLDTSMVRKRMKYGGREMKRKRETRREERREKKSSQQFISMLDWRGIHTRSFLDNRFIFSSFSLYIRFQFSLSTSLIHSIGAPFRLELSLAVRGSVCVYERERERERGCLYRMQFEVFYSLTQSIDIPSLKWVLCFMPSRLCLWGIWLIRSRLSPYFFSISLPLPFHLLNLLFLRPILFQSL